VGFVPSRHAGKAGFPLETNLDLIGTPNQVEWAEQIRMKVALEFDRAANAFRSRMDQQTGADQAETRAVIEIIEQKRAETMANTQAGYFIRDWQELSDQVRQMIFHDPRYQEIKSQREARRRAKAT
jgi:cell division FtsZ-interacting protein ZapD